MKRYVEHVRVSFVIQEQKKGVSTPLDSYSVLHRIARDEQRTSRMWTYIYFSIGALTFLLGRLQALYRKGDPVTYCIQPGTYMSYDICIFEMVILADLFGEKANFV